MVTPKFALTVLKINVMVVEPIAKHVNRSGHVMIVWVKMLGVAGSVHNIKPVGRRNSRIW
eukprot:5087780-Ditylum_brightwellii.AAC.1